MKNNYRITNASKGLVVLPSLKQGKQISKDEEKVQTDQYNQGNMQQVTSIQMKQGSLDSARKKDVENSIQELASAVKQLSEKINSINGQQNRMEQRFQSIIIEPSSEIISYLKKFQDESLKERKQNQTENKEISLKKSKINSWLGAVCRKVFSVGFLLYKKDEIKLKEVKAFCSENLLRNIINLSKGCLLKAEDFENIDNCLTKELLPYFKSKYPQTLESEVNMALSRMIIPIDNMESNDFDVVKKSGIKFQITKTGNYNSDIMSFINFIVEVPNRQRDESKSLFDCYFDKMNEFMVFICQRPQDRVISNNKNNLDELDKELKQKKKEKQYEEKVRSYSHFQIGQKLSKNFEKYSQIQITEEHMKFRSSAQMRVLTKWCEQLEKYFQEDHIMNRQIPFRMKDGSQGSLSNLRLRLLCVLLAHEKLQVTKRLKEIKENNHFIQSKFSSMNIHESLVIFLEEEAIVGQFSTGVYKSYENYLTSYLNVLIHRINIASKNFSNIIMYRNKKSLVENEYFQQILDKSKDHNSLKGEIESISTYIFRMESKRRLSNEIFFLSQTPQLISFNLGDLMRCRFTSKENQILTIYNKLQNDKDIKIVRVKNRLDRGNRDILINALFKNEIITEIQLCIKSEKSRFIECSNQFNHFLYELKRAQFGPISEMVNLWVNYDKRSEHFMQRIDEMFGPKVKKQKDYDVAKQNKINCCDSQMNKSVSLPFQCSFCLSHYFDVYESDGNTVCQNCNQFVCLNCSLKMEEIVRELPITNSQKIEKVTVMKQSSIFTDKTTNQQNLVLVNLKSKRNKVKPFRIIEEENKMHLFVKKLNHELELIRTFKKNEDSWDGMTKFLKKNLVVQVHDNEQFVPKFDIKEAIQKYFIPKYFEQVYKKQKDSILIQRKHLKDENLPQQFDKKSEKIKIIDFSQNELIDMKIIAKSFPNMQSANLSYNLKMSTIPTDIFELQKLKILHLSSNSISKLPTEMKYKNLEQLHLQNNQIEDIPNELFDFEKLRILQLWSNKISKLPLNKPNMNNLEELSLHKNQIEEIPKDFFNFNKLKILRLEQNKINKLPQNKPNMKSLETLYLNTNQIQEIPNEFLNFDNLKIFRLFGNKIKVIPQNISKLQNLQTLHIYTNQIQEIPNEFLLLDKLKDLRIFQNKIKLIPQNISKLKNLQILMMRNNDIEEIPNELFDLNKLKQLRLQNNKIQVIPQQISKLKFLEQLYLSGNQINIISSFFDFPSLVTLQFDKNPITKIEQTLISPKLKQFKIGQNLELDEVSQNNLKKIEQNVTQNQSI